MTYELLIEPGRKAIAVTVANSSYITQLVSTKTGDVIVYALPGEQTHEFPLSERNDYPEFKHGFRCFLDHMLGSNIYSNTLCEIPPRFYNPLATRMVQKAVGVTVPELGVWTTSAHVGPIVRDLRMVAEIQRRL